MSVPLTFAWWQQISRVNHHTPCIYPREEMAASTFEYFGFLRLDRPDLFPPGVVA